MVQPPGSANTTLPRGRRRLFTAITLALPWVLLALLEIGLRIGGYGESLPLFVPYADDPRFLFPNERVARRWFHGPFVPSTRLDFFRATKGPRTLRLFFQGESSAAGFPYGHGGAPSRMLEQRLQATFPDRDVEVVNTALTAVSSYVLLDQVDEIIARHPDAVLIYTGHNEYYGVFGAASTGVVGRSPTIMRLYLAARRVRIVQLLEHLLDAGSRAPADAAPTPAGADAPRTVMELMAGGQLVPLGSSRYARGLAQFRANLDALLARYEAAHVPVFIGTLVSNERDQRPLVSRFTPGADTAAWRTAFDAAGAALRAGDSALAEQQVRRAIAIDGGAADGLYALGRLRDAHGDTVDARRWYRAARERDELRFRAPEAMNDVIRQVAARHGATVVETEAAVAHASPAGIPGRTLILEHLHPNVDGYFVIADAFYDALRRQHAFGTWTQPIDAAAARRDVPVTPLDSVAALLRTDRLTSGWPFQPRGATVVAIADTLHPRTSLEELAQRLVNGRVSWAEATERLRAADEQAGDADGAIRVANALAMEYRYSARPYLDAARVAAAHGRDDDALRYARLAESRTATAEGAELLGLLTLRRGDAGEAVPLLQRAAQLAPQDGGMRGALAAARMLPFLEAGLARAPGDTAVLYKLAAAYALTQQYARARATLHELLGRAPAHEEGRALLARLPQ